MKTIFLNFLIFLFVLSCSSPKQEEPVDNPQEQNKTLKTIKIGDQEWTAENLNVKTDSGSWCYNDNEINAEKYGRLYNWETAKKLCPEGFRLPTIEDYYKLIKFYGTYDIAGEKLKSTKLWNEPSKGNADINSFNALPAGFYNAQESFFGENVETKFWTSSERGIDNSYFISLYFDNSEVIDDVHHKRYGLSVRYIKNEK